MPLLWKARTPALPDLAGYHQGMGRNIFAAFRANASGAEQGAVSFFAAEPAGVAGPDHAAPVHDHFVFAQGEQA